MIVEAVCCELVRLEGVDAVVLPADTNLKIHVDLATALRLGPEVARTLRKLGPQAPGAVVETTGGGLGVGRVFHAVVLLPSASGGSTRQLKSLTTPVATLRAAVLASLSLAERLGCTSLALPDLGATGGLTVEQSVSTALEALWCYFKEHLAGSLQRVAFVFATGRDQRLFQQTLEDLERRDPLFSDPEARVPTEVRTVPSSEAPDASFAGPDTEPGSLALLHELAEPDGAHASRVAPLPGLDTSVACDDWTVLTRGKPR